MEEFQWCDRRPCIVGAIRAFVIPKGAHHYIIASGMRIVRFRGKESGGDVLNFNAS